MCREHNPVAGIAIKKVDDHVARGFLPAEHDIVDGYAKLAVDCSQPVVLIEEVPLLEQSSQPHMRMFPSLTNVILQDMQDMQFAFGQETTSLDHFVGAIVTVLCSRIRSTTLPPGEPQGA